ncbi:MAG: hypothetical protein FWE95_00090 [Planctomycetaceae bacterium]|nr:hypothetical protein [Planctomycetaceae bacterium]
MSQNHAPQVLPTELQQLVEKELKNDEQLIWTGQPVLSTLAGFMLNIAGIAGVPALIAASVCFFFAMGQPWVVFFFAAFLGVFFLWGSLTFLSMPFVERQAMRNTVYAITDQRAIIFIKKRRTAKIVSYTPDKLDKLWSETNMFNDSGSGSITFIRSKRAARAGTGGFESIPSVQKVEQLLKDLVAKVPKDERTLEQHDDLPILHLLDRTPREIPLSLRVYLRQYSADVPYMLWGSVVAAFGFMFTLVGVSIPSEVAPLIAKLMFIGLSLPFGIVGLYIVFSAWYVGGPKMIRFLQDGIATKARHFATKPTGKIDSDLRGNQAEMQFDFEYQVDDKKHKFSVYGFDMSRWTDSPCKVVFYDPLEPSQSMLLDQFPLGVYFDELTGRFGVNPLRLVPAFLMAGIVCAEIAAIVWLAIWGF